MALKRLPEDFSEFLDSLNKNGVKYLLLGGWAVGIYGYPRVTADMDVLISTDDKNLDLLLKALLEFGAPTINKDHFREKGNVFRMGRSPIKIEIINDAQGITFEDCYKKRRIIEVDGIDVALIALEDLLTNKQASGRLQDLADVAKLKQFRKM